MGEHIPVLLNEVIDGLNIKPNGNYLDLTIGRAGHSSVILSRLKQGCLYGFDQDEEAIKESDARLSSVGGHYKLYHQNFLSAYETLSKEGLEGKFDGILMDLGVSSPQFDDGSRGFSYRTDAPLDMRMDQRKSLTARDVVNTYSQKDLTRIFQEYGEERFAPIISRNIIKARDVSPIETTFQLVEIIKISKPAKELRKAGHPAKQVFQALRIEVNDELNILRNALVDIAKLLAPKGRLAVITFHSLEDRIVKQFFKSLTTVEGDRIDGPTLIKEADYRSITNKPLVAKEEELEINNRAHSAKLRIIERK
ncbi:MAG: 16S rRNA (cytosine(1402)-N(4))-methyltransferase RsmH [Erysipelotrichaceae bacterium]|jgi:16S rRNA (cytosine1402-N4)-methyltransferase|nr:16S rRNA (cytosine(1402)-N(4))-methyltransferase RsmH [Erysipelotrichaceae bacterium]